MPVVVISQGRRALLIADDGHLGREQRLRTELIRFTGRAPPGGHRRVRRGGVAGAGEFDGLHLSAEVQGRGEDEHRHIRTAAHEVLGVFEDLLDDPVLTRRIRPVGDAGPNGDRRGLRAFGAVGRRHDEAVADHRAAAVVAVGVLEAHLPRSPVGADRCTADDCRGASHSDKTDTTAHHGQDDEGRCENATESTRHR